MDPLDSSFLQTSEKPTDRERVQLLTMKHLLCSRSEKCLLHNVQKSAGKWGTCETAESSAVSAWKRRVKLCPGQRGRSTAWWIWMEYQIATSEFLTGYPSNTQGTGVRRGRNTVWYLKKIKSSAGIFRVSEHTFCESAGFHPTLEYYAITCHIQPSHCWLTIIIKIDHMKFSPKESAIKQRII